MLYGRETWCLGQNEIGIFQRSESHGEKHVWKLVDKMLTKDQMQMLDFNETMDQLTKANSVRWYGHVLRKDKNNFLRRTLDLKVKEVDQRKSG